jgi:hypothetical protein
MSCSFGVYPSTRQAAPAASVSALRAAAERLHNAAVCGSNLDARRPNYLLDVPVSAIDVDRWERRWQEARGTAPSSSSSSTSSAVKALFQTASVAFAAHANSGLHHGDSSATGVTPTTTTTNGARHLAPFPPFACASVKTLPMTQLLKLRRQWLPHRQRFPVHQQRMGFLDAVLNHAVVALVGPAGSGRTLQVPIVLSETEVLKRRRLVVVSANAVAARLTVLRLREERGEDVQTSRTVAAALPNFVEVNESTSVVVTTAEVLLRQLLCDPCLEDVGCVVMDDVHLRSESTELCLALLRDVLTVQQQAEQQQQAAANAAPESGSGAQGNPEGTRRRKLHLVLNCPDEASASTLLTFLAPSRCKATTFALQPPSLLVTASTTLYLEETVQWLLKCEKEGSCLIREAGGSGGADGAGGTVEGALLSYAENVDAVARIMAASDADFVQPAAFRRYWLALIRECVDQYDTADRQARKSDNSGGVAASTPLPAILIVAPSNYYVHVITSALQEAHREKGSAEEDNAAVPRVFTALAEDAPFSNFVAAARRTTVTDTSQRWIVVTTTELGQTVLPSSVDIGLVVDCARSTYTAVDTATMADTCTTEYSSIAQLRYRRRLAKVTAADRADPSTSGNNHSAAFVPFVIQLIPKSVLHSAQHRRLNADPAQHIVFRLPFHRYVQLYLVLQVREEALLAQRAAVAASLGGNPRDSSGTDGSSIVPARISSLLSAMLIGVPAATANKYETLRRVMTSVEVYLRAAAHLAMNTDVGRSRLSIQPIGVLSLCLPVPFPVSRLLVAGALLRPSVAALTAIAALWCCSDLLSLQGVGAVRAADAADAVREMTEERAALLGEARLFFSRDSLSDMVAAFHVYQMWCSVRGAPDAERDFLEECGVPVHVLTSVFETQVGLCAMLHSFGLLASPYGGEDGGAIDGGCSEVDRAASAEEKALRSCIVSFNGTAEASTQLSAALGAAMVALSSEVSLNRVLHACVTAALYPNCIVPTGECGVGLLYDSVTTTTNAAAGGGGGGSSGSAGSTANGRRVASFAEDSLLASPEQAARAAGKPFLFLAKTIAGDSLRDAAGATSTTSTAIVEQLNPLHEAAAMVFCGHTVESTRKAPSRCRGWSSMLTKSWRETRRARGLPPVAQLPPTSIPVQSYDTVHCQQVVCTVDQNFSLTMRTTTLRWLQQLGTHVRGQLTALVRGVPLRRAKTETEVSSFSAVAAELADAWAWWERRHAQGKEWLREERVVVAHQQEDTEKGGSGGDTADGAEGKSISAAKAAALRQGLYGYYEWQIQPGTPAAVVVPSGAGRKAAAAKSAGAAAAAVGAKVADETNEEEAAATESGLPATYSGKLPPADVDHIFRQCARSMAAKGTREAEARLLRDSPDMFSFLNPEDPYHEYYLYLLRQAAPNMEVLGDNLEELISFLESVESELREELGYTDAAAGDTTAASSNTSGGGVLGYTALGNFSGVAGSTNTNAMWGGSGFYEVHDVVDEDGGEGEEGDMYAADGGGLQLESAAVNLKKNVGPTLAEQIEQARRAQAGAGGAKADSSSGGSGSTANLAAGAGSAQTLFSNVATGPSVSMMGGGLNHSGATTPFVSTSAGETLADKLKAMQMAAVQGTAVGGGAGEGVAPNNAQGNAVADFAVPQPTTEDLLAAINFGSEGDATNFAPAPSLPTALQQPDEYGVNNGGVSLAGSNSSVFQAPTTEELMALLGTTPPPTNGVLDFLCNNGTSVLGMNPTLPPLLANPLLVPPPALPAKALEERPPSVLVYPVPNCRRHGGNVRLLLAKSLGEVLNMRVGPTVIVGRVARVDVPNRNVEARALALKRFQCAEQTVFLLRNDRIIDDPEREKRERRERRERREAQRERDAAAAHHERRCLHTEVDRGNRSPAGISTGVATTNPANLDAYADPSAFTVSNDETVSGADVTVPTAARIGVLSSSEEDDDDSDSDSDSSSSSSSSSSASASG